MPLQDHSAVLVLLIALLLTLDLSRAGLVVASFSFYSKPSTTTTRKPATVHHKKATTAAMSSSAIKASASAVTRNVIGKLTPATTTFFLCDIQERFRPLMYNSQTIVSTSQYLTSIANTLSIPIVATQQYTKVFGPIVTDCFANGQEGLDALLAKGHVFEKKKFSMMTDEVKELFHNTQKQIADNDANDDTPASQFTGRDTVVLFGIEAHVCVQQTCLDLIELGKDVHVVVDCVSSQQPFDREISLQRMANAGAFLTTAQSLAFMLMQSADHPNFKAVSKLTVQHMKLPNEFNDPYVKKIDS